MRRILSPTAAPVPFPSLVRAMASSLRGNDLESHFQDELGRYFKARYVFLVSSGKAALHVALRSLQRISSRREIVIPAYSSFCLASAAARSGLDVRLCDIEPETLDFDPDELNSSVGDQTLAVIPVHNYGLACDMEAILKLASERGSFVVEDAAQAAGASCGERKLGALGDVGILSFGRGKNFCALGGGAVLTNNEALAGLMAEEVRRLSPPPKSLEWVDFWKGAALSTFLRPERYVVPAGLPFLRLGANVFDPGFGVGRFSSVGAAVGRHTFPGLDKENDIRIRNARFYMTRLRSSNRLLLPAADERSRSVYLRFPVVCKNKADRENIFLLLDRNGLGASRSYPVSLDRIPAFGGSLRGDRNFPKAQWVADRMLTLPTHRYVRTEDRRRIVDLILGCEHHER